MVGERPEPFAYGHEFVFSANGPAVAAPQERYARPPR